MFRRICILFVLALACLGLYAQESEYIREISVTTEEADYLYEYYFNTSSQLVEEHQFVLNGGQKVDAGKVEWAYEEDKMVRQTELRFVEGKWQTIRVKVLEYTENALTKTIETDSLTGEVLTKTFGYEDERLISLACEKNGTDSYSYTYVYNDGQLQQMVVSIDGADYMKVVYELPLQITVFKKQDDEWVNNLQYQYFYDAEHDLPTMQKIMAWKKTPRGMAWVNLQSSDYQYDGNNLVAESNHGWSGMNWEDMCHYTYSFEGSQLTHKSFELPIYRKWRTQSHIDNQMLTNPTREVSTSTYDFWGGNEGSGCTTLLPVSFTQSAPVRTKVGTRVQAVYGQQIITSSCLNRLGAIVNILPNPSNGRYIISCNSEEILSWNVCSLSGQLMQQGGANSMNIDITSAPAGVYLLYLTTKHGIYYQKLIKQ